MPNATRLECKYKLSGYDSFSLIRRFLVQVRTVTDEPVVEIKAFQWQDTRYKIFYLSFHVYNYTYVGPFTHIKNLIHTYETQCDTICDT